jgi:serine/threonine protein phosphatase PrpC
VIVARRRQPCLFVGRPDETGPGDDRSGFVQALVESAQSLRRPELTRNMSARALGQSMDLEVDLFKHFVKAGDHLIMCSDGLTKHLNPDEIKRIVLESGSPEEATLDLVELTNERGGEDNVSVIVVQFENAVEHDPDATVLDP